MIPKTTGPLFATDEADLLDKIKTFAESAGWTVVSSSTTPSNTYWFESSGEDGLHHIVGGFQSDTSSRVMRGFTAVDLDRYSIVSANIAGYTNNDAVDSTTPVTSGTGVSVSADFEDRDTDTEYRYIAVANKDAIVVLLQYTSSAADAGGLLYLGIPEPVAGRMLQKQARARIYSVSDGSIAQQKTITLDRNITLALKDTTSYPSDVHVQSLQFQSVVSGSSEAGFALVERIPIVSGSLTTVSGRTQFEINTVSGSKLAASGGRYDSGDGANDIVSLMCEPNIVICGARNDNSNTWSNNRENIITAWDAYCGQQAQINLLIANEHGNSVAQHDPELHSQRTVWYAAYCICRQIQTGLVTQADGEGYKNIGKLKHFIILPNQGQSALTYFAINGDLTNGIYLCHGYNEGLPMFFSISSNTVMAIGPGWTYSG